jgi:hypothetical protein
MPMRAILIGFFCSTMATRETAKNVTFGIQVEAELEPYRHSALGPKSNRVSPSPGLKLRSESALIEKEIHE